MRTSDAFVIVIEDRPSLRHLLVQVLEDAGYRVRDFDNAADALARLPGLLPDLVVLDMHLPGMSGSEFMTHLRGSDRWGDLPVLIVSGFGETVSPSADRTVAVLAKPFTNDTFLAWVHAMLGEAPRLAAIS